MELDRSGMKEIKFEEIQRFRELSVYILIAILQILFLWGLTQQLIFNKPWGTKPADDITLIIINLGVLMINMLFLSMNLKTVITDKHLSVRFFPFQFRSRIIPWHEVKSISLVKYDGIRDYWGYGLRYMPGRGWCYTMPGDRGIKLTLINKKEILIGTHIPGQISQIIDELIARGIVNTSVVNQINIKKD